MAPGSELGHAAPKARALSVFLWAALVREDSAFTVRWGCHWVLRFQQGRASCWAALCVLRPTENLSSFVPGPAELGAPDGQSRLLPISFVFPVHPADPGGGCSPLDVLRRVSSLLRWLQRGPWSVRGAGSPHVRPGRGVPARHCVHKVYNFAQLFPQKVILREQLLLENIFESSLTSKDK